MKLQKAKGQAKKMKIFNKMETVTFFVIVKILSLYGMGITVLEFKCMHENL